MILSYFFSWISSKTSFNKTQNRLIDEKSFLWFRIEIKNDWRCSRWILSIHRVFFNIEWKNYYFYICENSCWFTSMILLLFFFESTHITFESNFHFIKKRVITNLESNLIRIDFDFIYHFCSKVWLDLKQKHSIYI